MFQANQERKTFSQLRTLDWLKDRCRPGLMFTPTTTMIKPGSRRKRRTVKGRLHRWIKAAIRSYWTKTWLASQWKTKDYSNHVVRTWRWRQLIRAILNKLKRKEPQPTLFIAARNILRTRLVIKSNSSLPTWAKSDHLIRIKLCLSFVISNQLAT